jgi:hypothetical protein
MQSPQEMVAKVGLVDLLEISEPGDQLVNRRATAQAKRAASARNTSGRRRRIDPTTCERDYSAAQLAFLAYVQSWRTRHHKLPTTQTYLDAAAALGYVNAQALTAADLDEALRRYRQSSGRNFPTVSEILEVMEAIGWRKC